MWCGGGGEQYSNDRSDYVVGDARTASDNYLAILAFLEKFPQYNSTQFYISSESYGRLLRRFVHAVLSRAHGACLMAHGSWLMAHSVLCTFSSVCRWTLCAHVS
jgi:hypothetical protein